ncbi:MAG: hypothetical protein EHM42_12150, partial [Planctomycetaceae bacterium]
MKTGDVPTFVAPPAKAQYRVVCDERSAVAPRVVSRSLVRHAHALAREIDAAAVLVLADVIEGDAELHGLIGVSRVRTILVSRRAAPAGARELPAHCKRVTVPDVNLTRTGQVKVALLASLTQGLLQHDDRVVCLSGLQSSGVIDSCMVLDLATESELFSAADAVLLSGGVSPAVFERTLNLATQLASEGREGRPVGALFVIGDSDHVLAQSRPLVLNPFHGYPESVRNILDRNVEETIKEFSAIDGAFLVRGDGVVMAAGIQLVPTALAPDLPKGLGTRHAAACGITASTDAVAIVISESTGTITIFKGGEM